MSVEALIFDVDGTLAETEEVHRLAFNAAFAEAGLPWDWSPERYRALLATTGGKERIAAHQAGLPEREAPGLAPEAIAALHRRKTAIFGSMVEAGALALRPGVRRVVEAARAASLDLAVATTTSRANVQALCLTAWGRPADKVFDVIAAGDEVAAKKPAPDVYLLAMARLGRAADRCLAFEDSRNGVLSARAAGLRVVVTPSAYASHEDVADAAWRLASLETAHLPQPLARALRLR